MRVAVPQLCILKRVKAFNHQFLQKDGEESGEENGKEVNIWNAPHFGGCTIALLQNVSIIPAADISLNFDHIFSYHSISVFF